MKKLYVVKSTRDFDDIINNGKNIRNKYYSIYYKDNNLKYDRFGISVGKKLGNAVFRNKYKRKLRSIIDIYKKDYNNRRDYIIILRKEAENKEFNLLKEEFINLMNKKGK